MITFKKFNDLYNGSRAGYVQLFEGHPSSAGPLTPVSYDDIVKIASTVPDMEIGWIIPEGYIVIDIDDRTTSEIVLQIIQDRREKVMCVRTHRGMHIYAKSSYNNKTVNNILAIGAMSDTICHCNGKSFICTPFKNPRVNISKKLSDREVVYYNGIEDLPFWLTPVFERGKKPEDNFITFPLTEARNDTYNRQLWRLKKTNLTGEQRAECIRLINKYVASAPLDDKEMEATILRSSNNEDAETKDFFDGNTFRHDKMGEYLIDYLKIKKCSKTKLLYFYDEKSGIYISNDDYIKGVMTKTCPSLKDFQKREVITYINNYLELKLTTFSKNPNNVCFLNGILDLKTMKLRPHSPDDLETIQLHVNYNPEATGWTADEFFNTLTQGDKDTETLLYEAIGYSLLKTTKLQKAFLLYGPGRNGKSTYLDLIKTICGSENITSLDFKDLGEKFRVGLLYNKLVSLSGDISSQPLKDSDLFKQITSGDEIILERKNAHPFSDTVFATLFFSANRLPRTPDTTFGFYRRLVIIPLTNVLTVSDSEGAFFHEKLMADAEYVAYKAIQAIKEVLDNSHSFTQPESVKEITEAYRIDNSSVLSWIKINKITAKTMHEKKFQDVYAQYDVWCDVNKFKSVKSTRFEQEFCEALDMSIEDNTLIDKSQAF